jgi:N-acetylneuraminate synthase
MTTPAEIRIGHRTVGRGHTPLIVAEMSGNHNQSLSRALEIVDAAARAGAHALKLQTYTADTMTLDSAQDDFTIRDPGSLWAGRSLHALYQEAHTPWDWHEALFRRGRELGLLVFSTPFDETAVDFLESLDAPAYKIASFENTDLPLIRRVAATGKPMIVSTGMATLAELAELVSTARAAGCRELILLKCTSTYPASPETCNLRTLPHLREAFGCEVGLSDHTMGTGVSVAAVALGAALIEKHFTLRRADGGVDSTFSLEPAELAQLVVETERAFLALGEVRYGPTTPEQKSLIFRRSIYAVADIAAGEALTPDNIRCIRPGAGLPPKFYPLVLGRPARVAIARGTPLSWDLV